MTQWLEARHHGVLKDGRQLIAVRPGRDPVPTEKPFLVKVRRPRNLKHHNLYWAMIGAVSDATGLWKTAQALHRWLKMELGMYTVVGVEGDRILIREDSTDFMAMGQDEFRDFFDLAVATISLETGIDPLDLNGDQNEYHRH